METKDLSLTFIDHVEKKIQSPDREKFDKSKPGYSSIKDVSGTENDKDMDINTEQVHDREHSNSFEMNDHESSIDRSERFVGSGIPNKDAPTRSQKTTVTEASEELSSVNSFTYKYNLNEDEIASLNTQSSIDNENRVTVEKIPDDSAFVEERIPTVREEENKVRDEVKENLSATCSEMKEMHDMAHRTGIFEFTSQTSNILQFEKSRKLEHTVGRKRKELSPLTIEDDNTDGDGEGTDLDLKDSVPQQCSEDLVVSESKQDEQPMSPTTFTRDSSQHLIFEEDEENVIIHLETEFEQENVGAEKEVQTAEMLVEKTSLPNKTKTLAVGDVEMIPSKSLNNPIEVERKFTVTADTKIRLLELGAELRKEKTFEDTYYDNGDYTLTLSDCWLRQRNGIWEFKVAVSSFIKQTSSTQYSEITDENEICRLLVHKFDVKDETIRTLPLDDLVCKLKLDVFAKFTTTRQTYYLPECTIDLDLADFGFQVGEIEVMVADERRIPDALQTIDSVANKLGLTDTGKSGGKISAYLSTHNVTLYNYLLRQKVITPVLTTS